MTGTPISHRVATVWVLLAALLVIVVAVQYRDRAASRHERAARDPRMLVPVSVDELGAFEIADAGTLHRFERDARGAWFYHGVHGGNEASHTHEADAAMARRIEQTVAAFGRAKIERQFPRGNDARSYGLTAPRMVVLLYRPTAREPLVQFAVGDVAPDTVSRYVEVVGGAGVVTIPNYQIDNLRALIETVARAAGPRVATPPR